MNNNYICFFNSHKAWGGGEKWHSETAEYFHKNGYNVIVCGNPEGELLNHISPKITQYKIQLRNLSFLNPFKYWETYRVLKKQQISTIILCLPIDIKIAGVVAKILKIQNIIYRRGSAIPIKNSFLNRYLFSHVITDIIANSEATKRTILQNNQHLFDQEKITVLYNGIDIPEKTEKKQNDIFTIGTACRLEPQKNLFSLIEIAEKLKNKGNQFVIKIAGDGSLKNSLLAEIERKKLQECVKLVGFQSDMRTFYASLDTFVLTSHWEGFGYVLAEAMTYNLPLVAYDVSSNPELIKDSFNGFLVPTDDTEAFANRLSNLITNSELCEQLGNNARTFVEQYFDKQLTLKRVENYIQNLNGLINV